VSSTATYLPTDGEGLHSRGDHRSRKHSLTDSVPVARIAATNGQKPFSDATSDINNEIREKKSDHPHNE
jgi:glycerol-3-phosphate O-acyltransferase/dihydroxyacetone phosphate acyltransferase